MENKHLTRAKARATGEWVVGYYIGESGGDAYIIEPSAVKYDVGSIDTSPVHECDPKTVGRFSGLTDKNDKKIYKGDIVEVYDFTSVYPEKYRGVVKEVHCTWVVEYEDRFGILHPKLCFDDFANIKTEVIGNIHDNAELLKKGGKR